VEFGAKFEIGVPIGKLEVGAEVGTSTTRLDGTSTKHAFAFPLDQQKNCALAEVSLRNFPYVDPLVLKLLDLVRTNPCGNPDQYLKSVSNVFGRQGSATAKADISARRPFDTSLTDKQLSVNFGVSGGSSFGIDVKYKTSYDPATRGLTSPS